MSERDKQHSESMPSTEPASNGDVPLEHREGKPSNGQEVMSAACLTDFYKECGREVTLAYTTLNQMKNWAMVVAAAAISGLSFSTSSQQYPNSVMFVGVVIVYTFILRFFVRAILCYINLSRWNTLQFDYVNLLQAEQSGEKSKLESAQQQIANDIKNYYFRWLSPLNRSRQMFSTLKLGFALLFALPLFFIGWGILSLWSSALVKGFTFFAVGTTVLEVHDFLNSSYFDDPPAKDRRPEKKKKTSTFPIPTTAGSYFLSWFVILIVSVGIAYWFRPTLATGNVLSQEQGAVLVTSNPDHVLLELDGKSIGNAPARLKLSAGVHKYRAIAPQHDPVTGEMAILPGNDQSLYLVLLPTAKAAQVSSLTTGRPRRDRKARAQHEP